MRDTHTRAPPPHTGPALRTGILDDIIPIAKRAVDRLSLKLEGRRNTGVAVDLEQEFRLLTLQVIGDAVLSMDPEECDRVRVDVDVGGNVCKNVCA